MAARFWVGGTGTWSASNTTNWAGTSGGAGGQSVPGTADSVVFDVNSGTSFTVTIESGYDPSVISVAGGSATVTLNINDQTLTTTTFTFSNPTAVTRAIAFGTTGQITITGNGTTVFTVQTDNGLTTTGSRNVVFTYSGSVGTRSIGTSTFGALNTNSLNYIVQGGTDSVSFGGASGIVVRSLDMTGFSGTFVTNIIRAAGNVTFSPTMTMTAVATTLNFSGSSGATQTFTSAGLTIPLGITISTTGGGTVVFADDVTMPATQTLTLTSGTLDLNNRTVSVGRFSSTGLTARALAFGTSSVLNLTAGNGTLWTSATATNFTVTGTAVVNCTFEGVDALGRTINTGTMSEANAISFNITGGVNNTSVTGTYNNLNFTGYSGSLEDGTRTVYGNITISETMNFAPATAGITTTLAGTGGTRTITTGSGIISLNFNLNGAGRTWQLQNNLTTSGGSATAFTLGQGTLDLNNLTLTVATFVTSASTARSIAFGTSGVIDVTGDNATIWSASTVTGFSYTGTGRVNFTYNGSDNIRTIAHGPTGGSLATTAPPIYITAGTDQVRTAAGGWFTDIDFTGFAGSLTNSTRNIAGNLTFSSGMTVTGGPSAATFVGIVGPQTITTNAVTTDFPITIAKTGGNFVLSEPLILGNTRALTINGGNLVANGYDITVGLFSSSGSNIRSLDISDTTMTLSGTGVVWNTLDASNLSATVSNSTVLLSDDTTATKTVRLGTLPELDNIVIGGNTSTANTILLSNANTIINSITSTKTVAQTIGLNGSFTVNSWGIVGTETAPVTLTDNGSETVANLHYGGTGTVDVSYYTISYSAATPADTWYALTSNNNIDGGNNTGWIFGGSSSNFFLVF